MKKANRSKRQMRRFKLYVRESIRDCDKDFSSSSFLAPVAGRLGYTILSWSEDRYDALLMIYDKKILDYGILPTHNETVFYRKEFPEDCVRPEINWISIHSYRYKSDVWEMINKMAIKIREISCKK